MRILAVLLLLLGAPALPAADGQVTKTPYEQINLTLDFAARSPNGITLDSITIINQRTGADDTASILATSLVSPTVLADTQKVFFRVKDGVDGAVENIMIRVIKSDTGEKLEGNIVLSIQRKR